jgi:hypothetical protein
MKKVDEPAKPNGQRLEGLAELLTALVEKLQALRLPCILCRGSPFVSGTFIPTYPERLLLPGKLSIFGYNLCLTCAEKPGTPQRVEEKAFEYFALRRAGRVEPPQ